MGLYAALVGASVVGGMLLYIDAQSPAAVAIWMGLVVADFCVRQGLCLVFHKLQPAPAHWRPWALGFTLATLAGGLVWGVGAV